MSSFPETRHSLLVGLRRRDEDAWAQFVEIYNPLLWRVVRKQGLNEPDAADVVQEVLLSVYKSIETFERGRQTGSFRAWLATIARNTAINVLLRRIQMPASGGSSMHARLTDIADPANDLTRLWDLEHRKQWIDWAARQVRSEVEPNTFEAFWRTAILGESITVVSQTLGMTSGAVYVARGRVMSRLRKHLEKIEDEKGPLW